jgi:uncharacterized protein (TIGR03435 family)
VLLAIAFVAFNVGLHAQDAGNTSTFEIASIKANDLGSPGPPSSPDRFARGNVSLRDLITEAYRLQRFEVVGGPDWIAGAVRFSVNAKASFTPSSEQMRVLVQHLLADRFALRTHTEIRELPVYMLRVARKDGRLGKQLTRTLVDCAAIKAERIRKGESAPRPSGLDDRPVCTAFTIAQSSASGITLHYKVSSATSGDLADWLSPYLGRPVVDRTALTGDFDLDLAFNPGIGLSAAPGDDTVSIFVAIEEQLGLRLESDKAPVKVLVIDSAQLPTPD